MKRFFKLRLWVWALLLALIGWLWKDIPLDRVWRLLQGLEIWQLLSLVGLNSLLTVLFSLRWWMILSTLGYRLPYFRLVAYRLAGFALSFLTPGPQFGGEPLQVLVLVRRERIPDSIALASVMLDKTLELLINFSFLAFGVLVVLFSGIMPSGMLSQAWLPVAGLLLLPAGYLGLLLTGKRPFTALVEWISQYGIVAKYLNHGVNMSRSAEIRSAEFCRRRPGYFYLVLAASSAVWGLMMLEFWLSFHFLGLTLSFKQLLFMMVAARLAMLLPMPGGIGTVEASQMLAIRFLGLDPVYAVGIMLLARARDASLAGLGTWIMASLIHNQAGNTLPKAAEKQISLQSGG